MERLFLNNSSSDKEKVKCVEFEKCKKFVTPYKMGNGFYYPRLCHYCAAAEIRDQKMRELFTEVAEAKKRLNLPPRFQKATFENFKQELQPTAFAAASGFAKNYAQENLRGLYLFGHAGSGKTHLAAAIGNELYMQPGIRFVTAPELLLNIRKGFAADGDDGLLDRLSQTKLLIIDDLGSEKPTEWVQETLFVLIDRRYTHFLPTIITSNFSLDQLKDRLGYRIASRIAEVSEMVELRAVDYRIKKNNN